MVDKFKNLILLFPLIYIPQLNFINCSNRLFFFFLAAPGLSCSTQDLQLWHADSQLWHVGSSSLSRDQIWAPGLGSTESQSLDHQGSLLMFFIALFLKFYKMQSRTTHCFQLWLFFFFLINLSIFTTDNTQPIDPKY